MSKFIQVTYIGGQRALLKIKHIKKVTEQNKTTAISMIDGSYDNFTETFDEIKTLLENNERNQIR